MKLEHSNCAGLLVQAVHVLCDDVEQELRLIKPRESVVP